MTEPGPLLHAARSHRVGIVLLTGIGDVVHGLPLANDLKRDDPSRRILWVAEPAPAQVLHHHPAVDEVVVFHKARGLAGVRDLRTELGPRRCDLTLNLQRYFKGVFPTLFSGAPVRVGLPRSKTRDGVSWFNTHHLPEQPWRHTQDLFLDFRGALGLSVDAPVEWGITFSDTERAEQRSFFDAAARRPVAGLVLGTANHAKDWLEDRYVTLANRLEVELGFTVLLLGGPGYRERRAADLIMERGRGSPVNGLGDSVRRMMWMVDGVDLLISPDTGPLHIAHALDTPVVGLFGHSNPWRTGPWRRFRDLIIDRYTEEGAPRDPSAYRPKNGCMELITVDDVMEAVALALERYDVRPS